VTHISILPAIESFAVEKVKTLDSNSDGVFFAGEMVEEITWQVG
jgi:hypothetical protein